MGVELGVTFKGAAPAWPAIAEACARRGLAVQMRMIDGQLSFPDESPADAWNELRLGVPGGMVTMRRQSNRVALVVWGNADVALLNSRQALAEAVAEAGGGVVEGP
jgi:hypothetical protein